MNSYKRQTWVALAIGTSVVQFTSGITCRYVDLCQVTNSRNLNVFWSGDEVDALESRVWNEMSAAT